MAWTSREISSVMTSAANSYNTRLDKNDSKDDNNNNNDPWLINCTDTLIPDSVTDIIRLGEKFSSFFLSSKKQHVFEIIKDVESNIDKIPEVNDRDQLRHSIINFSFLVKQEIQFT